MSSIDVGTTGTYEWSGGETLDVNGGFAEDLYSEVEQAIAALAANDDGQYDASSEAERQIGDVERLLKTAVHLEKLGDPNELGSEGAEYFSNLAAMIAKQQDLAIGGQGNANEMRDILVSLNEALLRGEGIDPSAPDVLDPRDGSGDPGTSAGPVDPRDGASEPGASLEPTGAADAVDQGLVAEAGEKLEQIEGVESVSDATDLLLGAIDALIAALGGDVAAPPSGGAVPPEAVISDFEATVASIQAQAGATPGGDNLLENDAFREMQSTYAAMQAESGLAFTMDVPGTIEDLQGRILSLVADAVDGGAGGLSAEEALSMLANSTEDLRGIAAGVDDAPDARGPDDGPAARSEAAADLEAVVETIDQQIADLAGTGRAPEFETLAAMGEAYGTLLEESGADYDTAPADIGDFAARITEMLLAADGADGSLTGARAVEIVSDLVETLQGISDAVDGGGRTEAPGPGDPDTVEPAPGDPSGPVPAEPPEMAIVTTRFEGGDLVALASGGEITLEDGDGGVGIASSDESRGVKDEVNDGEVLTITLPDPAQAGSISFVDSSENTEILVVARDEDGNVVGTFDVKGDEDTNVVLDIDVPFASLEMSATEGSFAVSSVSSQQLEPVGSADGPDGLGGTGDETVDIDAAILVRLLQAVAQLAQMIAESQAEGGELVEAEDGAIRDATALIQQIQAALDAEGAQGDGVSVQELGAILSATRGVADSVGDVLGTGTQAREIVEELGEGIADLAEELRD